ncbi:WD40/YVTN/BNR-like repeat-containing protein [Marinigracilibium pacificum]|uniref:Photosynthesis system II assembly factor Ycf48/Hcf136-like domain-containing protein n=1 Tax=Marinigracilibium pacificum TaxID=2729599 RepID=A0A848J8S1_9BACT|nr:hypothetical protein [Marinigracilibium pacificum]NMM50890.1 hypothetical protein [Marinigracilibium pacificum]
MNTRKIVSLMTFNLLLVLMGFVTSCNKSDEINVNPKIHNTQLINGEYVVPFELVTINGVGFTDNTIFLLNDLEIPVSQFESSTTVKINVPKQAGTGYLHIKGIPGEDVFLLKVRDPGWNKISGTEDNYFDGMSFSITNRQVGFVYGNKLLKTTDGGLTWNRVNSPDIEGNPIKDLIAVTGDILYVFSDVNNLKFAKSTDGGTNWSLIDFPENEFDVLDLSFKDELNGYVFMRVYGEGDPSYSIYETSNGGLEWKFVDSLPAQSSDAKFTISGETNWLISEYFQKAYRIEEGSINSENLPLFIDEGAPVILTSIKSFAAGYTGSKLIKRPIAGFEDWTASDPCVLWESNNKGSSWSKAIILPEILFSGNLQAMDVFNNKLSGVTSDLKYIEYDVESENYLFRYLDLSGVLINDEMRIHINTTNDIVLFNGGNVYLKLRE